MQLEKFVASLSRDEQHELGLRLVSSGLPLWDKYCEVAVLKYRDAVVGRHHVLKKEILSEALIAIDKYLYKNSISKWVVPSYHLVEQLDQFTYPVASIRNGEWQMPEEVECVFYATYNLLRAIVAKDQPAEYSYEAICISQAIHALLVSDTLNPYQLNEILAQYN